MKMIKMRKMNKKGIAVIFIFIFIILTLIAIYMLLFLPIPAFTKIRVIINYFLIIILWLVIQALFLYGYFRIGLLAFKGFNLYKTKVGILAFKTQQFFKFK